MTTLIRPCASSAAPVVGGTYMFDRGTQHVPRFHQGIDIGISTGTPLYGCGDGRVVGVVRGSTGGGYYVIVRYLANGETVDVITMHMSRIDVSYGDAVTTSTQLGLSGGAAGAVGSGQSTGSHLHLQISVNQVLANPDTRLMSRTATAGGSGTPINPKDDIMDITITGSDGKVSTQSAELVIADIFARCREVKEIVAGLSTVQTFDSGPQASTSVLGDIYARAREIREIVAAAPAAPAAGVPFELSDADVKRIIVGVADELARRSQA